MEAEEERRARAKVSIWSRDCDGLSSNRVVCLVVVPYRCGRLLALNISDSSETVELCQRLDSALWKVIINSIPIQCKHERARLVGSN